MSRCMSDRPKSIRTHGFTITKFNYKRKCISIFWNRFNLGELLIFYFRTLRRFSICSINMRVVIRRLYFIQHRRASHVPLWTEKLNMCTKNCSFDVLFSFPRKRSSGTRPTARMWKLLFVDEKKFNLVKANTLSEIVFNGIRSRRFRTHYILYVYNIYVCMYTVLYARSWCII